MDKLSDQALKAFTSSLLNIDHELQQIHSRNTLGDIYILNSRNPMTDVLRECVPSITNAIQKVNEETQRREGQKELMAMLKIPGSVKEVDGQTYVLDVNGRMVRVTSQIKTNSRAEPGQRTMIAYPDHEDPYKRIKSHEIIRSLDGAFWIVDCEYPLPGAIKYVTETDTTYVYDIHGKWRLVTKCLLKETDAFLQEPGIASHWMLQDGTRLCLIRALDKTWWVIID